ncbi:hypothetical protein BC832DRAFT_538130 [Gaertneriomyces semiglobifer]|nr:hypothetical protein BC832DRAFT_538130 [Gaertneriomyces semiglobifer]
MPPIIKELTERRDAVLTEDDQLARTYKDPMSWKEYGYGVYGPYYMTDPITILMLSLPPLSLDDANKPLGVLIIAFFFVVFILVITIIQVGRLRRVTARTHSTDAGT